MNLLMKPWKKTVSDFLYKTIQKARFDNNDLVLYKIVDSYIDNSEEYYKLQCLYTKAIIELSIQDLVFDLDILHGLHPIQGCFVGLEYAKILKANSLNPQDQLKQKNILSTYVISRCSNYNLLYQDRNGMLGFECNDNGKQFIMDPRDLALSRELIEEFSTAQAFCIGVLAGLKFESPVLKVQKNHTKTHINYLRLVQ